MDNQEKTLLITVALAILILYIARPKRNLLDSKDKSKKTSPPKTMTQESSKNNNDGSVIISAMRQAITDDIPQKEIDALNEIFLKEYGLKVFFGADKKLVAKDKSGKIVTRE